MSEGTRLKLDAVALRSVERRTSIIERYYSSKASGADETNCTIRVQRTPKVSLTSRATFT